MRNARRPFTGFVRIPRIPLPKGGIPYAPASGINLISAGVRVSPPTEI